MTVSYSDETRRDDLRAAALFIVDSERQQHGFDKRVRGSLDLPDVGRNFEEALGVFTLDSEVGGAIRSADEIPCWSAVLQKLEPLWKVFPRTKRLEPPLAESEEWLALRTAVEQCVERHGLWLEEIEFPVAVAGADRVVHLDSQLDLEQAGGPSLADAVITDSRGRTIELTHEDTVRVLRVSLPRPDSG